MSLLNYSLKASSQLTSKCYSPSSQTTPVRVIASPPFLHPSPLSDKQSTFDSRWDVLRGVPPRRHDDATILQILQENALHEERLHYESRDVKRYWNSEGQSRRIGRVVRSDCSCDKQEGTPIKGEEVVLQVLWYRTQRSLARGKFESETHPANNEPFLKPPSLLLPQQNVKRMVDFIEKAYKLKIRKCSPKYMIDNRGDIVYMGLKHLFIELNEQCKLLR